MLFGDISNGTRRHKQMCMESGCIDYLERAITHKTNIIRENACWALKNIASGTSSQSTFLRNHRIYPKALECLLDNVNSVRVEAAYILQYTSVGGIKSLSNLFSIIKLALNSRNSLEFVHAMLRSVKKLLKLGKKDNEVWQLFVSSGCMSAVGRLLVHENRYISEEAHITVKYRND